MYFYAEDRRRNWTLSFSKNLQVTRELETTVSALTKAMEPTIVL